VAYLQWQALLQADDTTRRLQRAFVWVEPIQYRKKPDGSGDFEVFVHLRNSGSSAAEHTTRENGICWSSSNSFGSDYKYPMRYPPLTPAASDDERLKAFGLRCVTHVPQGWAAVLPAQQAIDNGAATLPLKNSRPGQADEDVAGLQKEFSSQPSSQTRFLFVFGRVDYEDVFGERHKGEYCSEVHGGKDELYSVQCAKHNCTDRDCDKQWQADR
jgi:hypothetical protein